MKVTFHILFLFCLSTLALVSCSTYHTSNSNMAQAAIPEPAPPAPPPDYALRLPQTITSTSKTIVVDPSVHAWGAYQNGELIRAGLATAGSNWCPDIGRPCRTKTGSFRIYSLGGPGCKSSIYPLPRGGAPMPYCMYFNGGQGLHGSPPGAVREANLSHGCVRMHVEDAEWVRYNFATIGTRVIVRPYN